MRTVKSDIIIETVKEMCIEANHFLSQDVKDALDNAKNTEKSSIGKDILTKL